MDTNNQIQSSENKPYKEEDYNSYLMKNYEDTLEKKNEYDMTDMTDMTYEFNDRKHQSHFYSNAVSGNWRAYCNTHPSKTGAELMERALIGYMINNPHKKVLLDFQLKVNAETDIQHQSKEAILYNKFKKALERVIRDYEKDKLQQAGFIWETFMKYFEKASAFPNPSPRLEELMNEALFYIG